MGALELYFAGRMNRTCWSIAWMRVSKESGTTCRSLNLYHRVDSDLFLTSMAKMGRRVNLISWNSQLLEVLSLK